MVKNDCDFDKFIKVWKNNTKVLINVKKINLSKSKKY